MCWDDTSPRCHNDATAIGVSTDDVQIGPVLDVIVFKIAQLFVVEVQVPPRSPDEGVQKRAHQ